MIKYMGVPLDTPKGKGLSWLASWLTVPSLPAFSHGPSNIILRYRPFPFSSLWLGASVGCRLAKHRPPSGVVTKYREKKSLGMTKDRKSTLSTDAGKAVEKGTCDQFVLLSNRVSRHPNHRGRRLMLQNLHAAFISKPRPVSTSKCRIISAIRSENQKSQGKTFVSIQGKALRAFDWMQCGWHRRGRTLNH